MSKFVAMATSSSYSEGVLLGSDKDWYHGKLTGNAAEQLLVDSGQDCFLVRQDGRALTLSLIHEGKVHHMNIKYGPGWYELEGGAAKQYSFIDLDELVSHYQSNVLSADLQVILKKGL